MAVYYIDPINGLDSNGVGTESAPRKTFPTSGADGDVYRLKRGTTYTATNQLYYWNRQGVVITDYGNPAAPKPKIDVLMATGTSALNFTGDTILHNLEFSRVQRDANQTTDSNVGPNCLLFAPRGGAASGTVEGVSGVVINCDFRDIGNNAIVYNGISSEADIAFASPLGIVLGCSFDSIGSDGVDGALKTYGEVGWCTFTNMGNRIDPGVADPGNGIRRGSSDCVNWLHSVPAYSWIHDNYMDHSHWDCKHSVIADGAPSQANNLVLVERNIMIGYGSPINGPFIQSRNNVGVNTQHAIILRQNYIRGSRILFNSDAQTPWADIYSNIFEVTGTDNGSASISCYGDNHTFRNNTVRARNKVNTTAVAKTSGADKFAAYRNVITGHSVGFSLSNPVQASYGQNAFYDVDTPYVNGATPLATGAGDIIGTQDDVRNSRFTPSDARLLFSSVDKRVPDFWGRFASEGIAHIGATIDAF